MKLKLSKTNENLCIETFDHEKIKFNFLAALQYHLKLDALYHGVSEQSVMKGFEDESKNRIQ